MTTFKNTASIDLEDFPEVAEKLGGMEDGETCQILLTVTKNVMDDKSAELGITAAEPYGGYKEGEGGEASATPAATDEVMEWAKSVPTSAS